MEKGMNPRSFEIAKKMLAKGMDVAAVMEITGLSADRFPESWKSAAPQASAASSESEAEQDNPRLRNFELRYFELYDYHSLPFAYYIIILLF